MFHLLIRRLSLEAVSYMSETFEWQRTCCALLLRDYFKLEMYGLTENKIVGLVIVDGQLEIFVN